MKIIECDQGSSEWHKARRGVPTASEFSRIITPKTGKLAAAAEDYICELIADRLGLAQLAPFTSRAAQSGLDTEPEARNWYELQANLDVVQVGFCLTDDGRFGCSPDGLVGDEGGLELKCPQGKTHVRYLLEGGLPAEHKAQVHGALIVTGRAWWDFMSYCPGLETLLVRVERDDFTDALGEVLEKFWDLYQAKLDFIERKPLAEVLAASIAEVAG